MDKCSSALDISAQPTVQTAHQQGSTPAHLSMYIWREIATFATADSVLTLRQVSPEIREAVDSLTQADFNRINEHHNSTIDLYKSDDEVGWVTRTARNRQTIASDANASPALQCFLANRDNPFNVIGVRRSLAENPKLTVKVQQILAQDNTEVRRDLAGNPNLTMKLQQTLARDNENWVRWYLAFNTKLAPSVQRTLAKDDDNWVRRGLANNHNLAIEVQCTLAQDNDTGVRSRLSDNPNLLAKARMILILTQLKSILRL